MKREKRLIPMIALSVTFLVAFGASALLASQVALADKPSDAGVEAETAAQQAAEADVKPTVSPTEPKGLDIPLDGSSLEAFEASLERIRETSTEAEYQTLTGALDYLLVYTLSVKRDRAKLAEHLDGQTGYEIINQIGWGKRFKASKKAPTATT